MTKIGVKGQKTSGKYTGWYILIERDEGVFQGKPYENYYRYIGKLDPKRGYDDWFQNYADLVVGMESDNFKDIRWLDDE